MFNTTLKKYYIDAYTEENISYEPMNQSYAIFPKSLYKTVDNMQKEKTQDYCFIGKSKNEYQKWIFPFINKYFNKNSYLQFTDHLTNNDYTVMGDFDYTLVRKNNTDIFNNSYYSEMKKSKFCLCPADDDISWSTLFYEALMCKCIPIVSNMTETYRSIPELKLNYKYYLSTDTFVYREDWAEYNYALFLKYHTLHSTLPVTKCNTLNCNYLVHTNPQNNGGTHCCRLCKTNGTHGPYCEHISFAI